MPDVDGCLWSGVIHASVCAGPTDLQPEAIAVQRSVAAPVQEATQEPVRRVSNGCRLCTLLFVSRGGGFVQGGRGGEEPSQQLTVLLFAWCDCWVASCCA